jgi:hypothetical protein
MATTDAAPEQNDRQTQRRRPFATWVKKLTNFKSSSDGDRPRRSRKTKRGAKPNNPYPESGCIGRDDTNGESAASFTTAVTGSNTSIERSRRDSGEEVAPPTAGGRSMAGTVSTDHEGTHSLMAPSHGASSLAGTSRTVGGGLDSRRGGDSTFSSPAPSVRSLTTTLTTIQSVAPTGHTGHTGGSVAPTQSNAQSIHFSQPFPTTSPASAIPPHLAPTGNPVTYNSATAHNLLTDNASILTLASSSKRRRRRSMDTDASVRALAPSSLWGGSRESLPLSVLSSNIEGVGVPTSAGMRAGAERNSIYSTTGPAPAIASERNSIYAGKGDGASVRSGLFGHGRADSVSGSNAGALNQLATPQEVPDDRMERATNGFGTTREVKEE